MDPTDDSRYIVFDQPSGRLYANLIYIEHLSSLLRKDGTKLAVFSACNSSRWSCVEPLLRAEVPVIIGTEGIVLVDAALAFCSKFYRDRKS